MVTALFGCYMAGAMWNCCHLSTSSVYTTQPCTSLQCHFIQSNIRRMHVCLAETCHVHVWQNGRGLLHTTVVKPGWNRYWNKSQHRKLTLEKKVLLQGLEPKAFQSWVRHSYHWAIPIPQISVCRKQLPILKHFSMHYIQSKSPTGT